MTTAALHPHSHRPREPVVFDEFFEMGQEERVSPFLTESSRTWGINIHLKASLLAALLLVISFGLSFSLPLLPLSYILLTFVYFLAGMPSLIESIEDLLSLQVNIDVLMTLAAFSSVIIGSGMEGGLLLVLFAISGAMEEAVAAKAKGAISSLKRMAPSKACVIEPDGTVIERALTDVTIGTPILVKAGEMVPLDGVVTEGDSSVNLVHLTGESLPVPKGSQDAVPAGALNLDGILTLRVTHTCSDSTLARIIRLVTQAQEARPKLQRWFDAFSEQYAITIILLSALFAIAMPYTHGLAFLGYEGSVYRALAFLIAASPCALIIAIPIAYLSAVSSCARKGILLKGGVVLDALASCQAIAFDKTGTLTTGQLSCRAIEPLSTRESQAPQRISQALAVAAAMEQHAVHPIAKAIVALARAEQVPNVSLQDFKTVPGYGLEATALLPEGPIAVAIGRVEFITPRLAGSAASALQEQLAASARVGELQAVLLLGQELFLFRFSDTIRPEMSNTLARLHKLGSWRLLMLTGDRVESARKIAQEIGLDEFYAGLRPEDKLTHVTRLSNELGLAMVGDGINDAPALARATVGISMGKVGSAAAVEAADVILLQDNLEQIDWLMSKAKQTQAIVKENLALAVSAMVIASTLALAGTVPLWLAVVLHEGGTVLVGLNALRLLGDSR